MFPQVLLSVSIIAEFTVPPSEFALAETFDAAPKAILNIERAAAHRDNYVFSLCWVNSENRQKLESALDTDSTVEDVVKLTESEEAWLYQLKWEKRVRHFIHQFTQKATIIEATGTVDGWELRVLFEDHSLLSETNSYLRQQNIVFDLNRLYKPGGSGMNGRFALTQKQRSILTTAVEAGYFETPREITMTELADKLGISQQAASTRLRRAHASLIESVFGIKPNR